MSKDNNIRTLRHVICAGLCSRTPQNVKYAIAENDNCWPFFHGKLWNSQLSSQKEDRLINKSKQKKGKKWKQSWHLQSAHHLLSLVKSSLIEFTIISILKEHYVINVLYYIIKWPWYFIQRLKKHAKVYSPFKMSVLACVILPTA